MSKHLLSPPHILIVEDDENLRLTLADNLGEEGYQVDHVGLGQHALKLAERNPYDILILDIMLPDMDGYRICQTLRKRKHPAKIIMLTARSLEDDLLRGFDVGADDYLTKPYRLRELFVRIRALLRRNSDITQADSKRYQVGEFSLNEEARTAYTAHGELIELTRKEFDLLLFFVHNLGRALSRNEILDQVWGKDISVEGRTVDNFVSSLKKKLGWTPQSSFHIRSVRGVGYRLEVVSY